MCFAVFGVECYLPSHKISFCWSPTHADGGVTESPSLLFSPLHVDSIHKESKGPLHAS